MQKMIQNVSLLYQSILGSMVSPPADEQDNRHINILCLSTQMRIDPPDGCIENTHLKPEKAMNIYQGERLKEPWDSKNNLLLNILYSYFVNRSEKHKYLDTTVHS